MEGLKIPRKLREWIEKYKYAIVILLIGLTLLLIPEKQPRRSTVDSAVSTVMNPETLLQESLAELLQAVDGAGKVRVMLSTEAGEETIYQTDMDSDGKSISSVIITDSERKESGLIRQINPAVFKGAVVVCQGADSPAVRLAVTQAVSKITGLGSDAICVLKMQ